jgi:DNA-binding response OmpR family regulator
MLILVVDDEAIIGLSIAVELLDAGHQVLGPATSISEAKDLAGQSHPDLALIDVDIDRPGDGIDLARDLRSGSNVHSLFITARPAKARAHPQFALGVIEKPFMSSDVARSVAVVESIFNGDNPPPAAFPCSLELFARLH